MVPNTGTQLPFGRAAISEVELAAHIGSALQGELGASRRATKTVMRWTGVSDHTARSWLNGRSTPGGLHLLNLAMNSMPVMMTFLRLAGHVGLEVALELERVEAELEHALQNVRTLRARTEH